MANEDADAISAQIIKQKKLQVAPASQTKRFLESRLTAGFIWRRARDLLPTEGAANLPGTIDSELTAVQGVLNTLLGADRKSGTLLGPRAPGTSDTVEHLDLADLAHQRVASDDPSAIVSSRRRLSLRNRRTAVLTIAWRAVTLETAALWSSPRSLNVAALNEMIDRRLRTIERMQYNVGDAGTMLKENNAHYNFVDSPQSAQPTSGWFDQLRVRLFEYMEFPSALLRIPGIPSADWLDTGQGTAQYNHFPTVDRTLPDGARILGTPANAWHFLEAIADNWRVSLADGSFYRIDLLPEPVDAAAVVDAVFDYRTLKDGIPQKADIWNRSWLLCDEVISVLHLEALLFGLRRRLGTSAGETIFRALVAKRPQVTQTFEDDATSHTFDTPFVSLGGFTRNTDEASSTGATVLMQSDQTAGDFVDPFFRNERITIDQLQVGDQIKFLNSPIYRFLTRNQGVWKLENALVVALEPTAEDESHRTNVALGSLRVQGHGTIVETYDSMRKTLGKSLERQLQGIFFQIGRAILNGDDVVLVGQPRGTAAADIKPDTTRIFRWAPFPENNVLSFPVFSAVGNKIVTTPRNVPSAPWWIAIPLGIFDGDLSLALASIPHAIGRNDAGASNVQPIPRFPELKLLRNQNPLDKYIVFPLFEPTFAPAVTDLGRGPWGNYFAARQGTPIPVELRPVDVAGDVSFIPGLYYKDASQGGLRVFGTVRPNPSP